MSSTTIGNMQKGNSLHKLILKRERDRITKRKAGGFSRPITTSFRQFCIGVGKGKSQSEKSSERDKLLEKHEKPSQRKAGNKRNRKEEV